MTGLLIAAALITAAVYYGLREHGGWAPRETGFDRHVRQMTREMEALTQIIGERLIPAFKALGEAARHIKLERSA